MAEIIEGIHPTRSELMEIEKRIELAEKGHKLLKEKRDTLMTEFLGVMEKAKGVQKELNELLGDAYKDLIAAESVMSTDQVESIAVAMPESRQIDLSLKNVMGVSIPEMDVAVDEEKEVNSEYRTPFTSAKLDDSVESFRKVLEKLIKLVEMKETIIRLGEEIKNTTRRVNALEHVMIPRLKATEVYIEMRLQEMERENFFRLKSVKKKKQEEEEKQQEMAQS